MHLDENRRVALNDTRVVRVMMDHGKFHIRHDPNTETQILYDAKGHVVVDIVGSDIVAGSPNTFATASKPPLSLTSVLDTIRQRLTS